MLHDPLAYKQVFIKEWTSGEVQSCLKGCRKISILKAASSPRILDQVYPIPVETASKDNRLRYKHVLRVAHSQELKVQVFKDICLV